jgi:hypothetical protein
MRISILLFSFSCAVAVAQNAPAAPMPENATPAAAPEATSQTAQHHVTVPAGTEVLLQLKSGIDTKNSKVGDGVYCQTTFPVIVDNVVAIPPGTYVKGEIVRLQRAGKIKGRAEMQFKFTSLIFPNGYTVDMPGTLHHDSGTPNADVDEEGQIKADSQKGKDAATVGKAAGIGAAGGGIITGSRTGALGGGAIGALAGLATIFSTRGQDVRIEPGTSLKMLLQVPLTVDVVPVDPSRAATEVVPRPTSNNRLPLPDVSKPK